MAPQTTDFHVTDSQLSGEIARLENLKGWKPSALTESESVILLALYELRTRRETNRAVLESMTHSAEPKL